ncbi:sirohydrochlorin chelatase [Evansella cellulosilytica]|uniref:Cobalamin (Vitamin B12) biosynthesis CbiX protein n=1 Tax=Evansella cellulosilytica (strain ATCC 21833 / DSM 2522 / FERM P-1141 / JCM 9156 / N-4) TaxID=649639 RepID=E6U1A6_EVAC2|nr:CbiX/SirB N-terminal domain-containing protein [Evansella cellulosilytica]ADU29153.1 cobalamin (vitamin B12) biosynthesis CbiX protein [Evansella cellulosilytica DSM 2522]
MEKEQWKKGVLILAHGSRDKKWVQLIDESVDNIKTDVPVTIGYLELIEGRSIADGVRRLEQQGVEEILAIPFFVCSGSTHLAEIQYALGVIKTPLLETDLPLIHPKANIVWGEAMDYHPFILKVLEERISSLTLEPENERLLLVAHGSNRPDFEPKWEKTLRYMCTYFKEKYRFNDSNYGTILPDTITEAAEQLSDNNKHKLVVVPVFLSEGYYTSKKIPSKLVEVDHVYDGKTYLPHSAITEWLQEQVNNYV